MATHVAHRSRLQRFWWLFKRAWVSGYKDNVFGIAKGAAYSGLLSLFPILTTITAILVQANAQSVSNALTNLLFEVVPPGTQAIIRTNLIEGGYRPLHLLATSILVSLLAASGVMMTLMEGFRAAYRIPRGRSFWHQRGVAAVLVVTAALPVVIASSLMVFGGRVQTMVTRWIGLLPAGVELQGGVLLIGTVVRYVLALLAIVLSIAALYHLGPNHPRRYRRTLWPGAMLAAALWLVATVVFAWYVRNIANYNVFYGSIAAVIALLVWMYVLSIIALIGCEFNAEHDRLRESGLRT